MSKIRRKLSVFLRSIALVATFSFLPVATVRLPIRPCQIAQRIEKVAKTLPGQTGGIFISTAYGVLELALAHPAFAADPCISGWDPYNCSNPGLPVFDCCCTCRDDGAGDREALYCADMPGGGSGDLNDADSPACPARDIPPPPPPPTVTPVPPTPPGPTPPPPPPGDGGGNGGGEDVTPVPVLTGATRSTALREGECEMEFVAGKPVCRIVVARAVYKIVSGGASPPPATGSRFLDTNFPTEEDEAIAEWLAAKGYFTDLLVIKPFHAPSPRYFCPLCPVSRAENAHWDNMVVRGPGLSEKNFETVFKDIGGNKFAREIAELEHTIYVIGLGPDLYDPEVAIEGEKARMLLDLSTAARN